MRLRMFSVAVCAWIGCGLSALAADHQVTALNEGPPDALSAAIVEKLSEGGFKVTEGTSRTICEIWLAEKWPVTAGFEATSALLYPFKPGQLIGAIRFPRRTDDFRGQQISSGVYTLRYAQQPVDGNHVGTSDTRDFLLLVSPDADQDAEPLPPEDLSIWSAEAAGTTHPAMFSMLPADADGAAVPSIVEDADREWTSVRLRGSTEADGQSGELVIRLVVVGRAAE